MLRWITVIGFTFLLLTNIWGLRITNEDRKKAIKSDMDKVREAQMLLGSPTFERMNMLTVAGTFGILMGVSYFPLVFGLALNGTTIRMFVFVMVVFFIDLLDSVYGGYEYIAKRAVRDGWYGVRTSYGATNPFIINNLQPTYREVWAVVWMAIYAILIYVSATNL